MTGPTALRGAAITFRDDPFQAGDAASLVHEPDALVVIEDGRIARFGPHDALRQGLATGIPVAEYRNCLICPGFVDAHVHYPQLEMIGAHGAQLWDWLERYTFPTEMRFADPDHAERVAARFLQELLRCGTTTAAVYCTVHPWSVDAFVAQSHRFNTLMVAGKVLMDRNAPAPLLDTVQSGYDDSAALIERWHGVGRQRYCVTPRFAPTSTEAQLDAAAALLRLRNGLFVQTHLSENRTEVEWVRQLFPGRASYLDVYAHAGLVGERSVFGHAIHLDELDFCTCHAAGAALAHCPSSNLFLGSGLFRLADALDPRRPVRVGLGSDVGAGTSLSLLRTMGAAYGVAQLAGRPLSPVQGFWLASAGGARALSLEHRIGRLAPGFEADLCVLHLEASPLLALRTGRCDGIIEVLAALMAMGDDRTVRATYVAGHRAYDRDRTCEPFSSPQ